MTKQMKNYESEFTIFMRGIHKERPSLAGEQLAGRARLWDRAPVLLSDQEKRLESIINQQAYPYQTTSE